MTNTPPEGSDGAEFEPGEIVATEEIVIEEEPGTDLDDVAQHARTGINRTVWVLAAVSILALAIGIVIGRFVVKSPAQIAAEQEPPEAGPITVEVENRRISSDLAVRGDVVYDDAQDIVLETAEISGPAIVTGAVPEVGAELDAGSVIIEVAGRPVIALPGELPVYRSLRAGATGPDVEQLQQALRDRGYDAGSSGTYDSATANAVAKLFTDAGYPAPEPDEGARDALRGAQDAVRSAESSLTQAQKALDDASKGVPESTRIEANNWVNSAQRALDDARSCRTNAPVDEETGKPDTSMCPSVADAEDALRLAKAQRNEALVPPSTAGEREMRDAAQSALTDARDALAQAQLDVLTPMPASELVYLSELPRRIDSVNVSRGTMVSGTPAVSVSGATLQIVSTVSDSDAQLVEVGSTAYMTVGDLELTATVADVTKQSPGQHGWGGGEGEARQGRTYVVFHPDDITEEQREEIFGRNVRITIPVSSTDGEVMAVPDAALTAGPGGEVRVEVMRADRDLPELVVVKIGLSANGYTEIVSSEEPLAVGDLVVVGQRTGSSGSTSPSEDSGDDG